MVENVKCLQYYFDSKTYDNMQISRSIEETKREFPKKTIDVKVDLNNYGVYIVTFYIKSKNNYFTKIVSNFKNSRNKKKPSRFERYTGENKYGKYKPTKIYRPY